MALNVIMLGAPGAGKGTQAERFARQRGLPKISTGDILRQGIKDQVPVALVAKAKMDRGELVDDETMLAIARERLARPDAKAGFVLDGFPRTVSQARALDGIMKERRVGPLLVVDIVVPEADLVRRLVGRRICSKCGTNAGPAASAEAVCQRCGGTLVSRADDSEEIVHERLRVYTHETRLLIEYYHDRPTFFTINGAQKLDDVARELGEMIDVAVARTRQSVEASEATDR